MEGKVEAPGDAHSRKKIVGGSHLQGYKKPVVENQRLKSKINIASLTHLGQEIIVLS